MRTTRVVNLRDEPYDVYVGRGRGGRVPTRPGERGYYGNPIPLRAESERGEVLDRYRRYFLTRVTKDPVFRAEVLKLKGLRISCFCKPAPCHGDVIAEWLDSRETETGGAL